MACGEGARDIITLLSPFGIAPKRAVRFFKIYGRDAADIIRQHPYRLCEVRGIGFKTADEIAKSVGFDLSLIHISEPTRP